MAVSYKRDNELSGIIICGELLSLWFSERNVVLPALNTSAGI